MSRQIYLVSSVAHHVSILHLRVHPKYLEWLAADQFHPDPANPRPDPDPEWFKLELQRTPWYDLFDPEQRVQAMRACWGVLGYLMRNTSPDKTGHSESDEQVEALKEAGDENMAFAGRDSQRE